MRTRLPASFVNPITLGGVAIAAVSFIVIVFLAVLEYFAHTPNPYMGILAFVIVPSVLLSGLAIAAFGVWREHRLQRVGKPADRHMPVVDLNNPSHRAALALVSFGSLALILFSSFGSFKAYEHMESDAFCGQSCHTVMEPEYTLYANSPHAKVGCVQCHIGSGAGWFVRSKLSGSYQLYAVLFNKFTRPIETPITNLRPAQETCEQCHWPQAVLQRQAAQHHVLHVGREEHEVAAGPPDEDRRGQRGRRADDRHPLAHEHRQQGDLHPARPVAADHSVGPLGRPGWHRAHVPQHGGQAERSRFREESCAADGLHRLPQPAVPHLPAAGALGEPPDVARLDRSVAAERQGPGGLRARDAVLDHQGRRGQHPDRHRGVLRRQSPGAAHDQEGPDRADDHRSAGRSTAKELLPADEGELEGISRTTSGTCTSSGASAATTASTSRRTARCCQRTATSATRSSRRSSSATPSASRCRASSTSIPSTSATSGRCRTAASATTRRRRAEAGKNDSP